MDTWTIMIMCFWKKRWELKYTFLWSFFFIRKNVFGSVLKAPSLVEFLPISVFFKTKWKFLTERKETCCVSARCSLLLLCFGEVSIMVNAFSIPKLWRTTILINIQCIVAVIMTVNLITSLMACKSIFINSQHISPNCRKSSDGHVTVCDKKYSPVMTLSAFIVVTRIASSSLSIIPLVTVGSDSAVGRLENAHTIIRCQS